MLLHLYVVRIQQLTLTSRTGRICTVDMTMGASGTVARMARVLYTARCVCMRFPPARWRGAPPGRWLGWCACYALLAACCVRLHAFPTDEVVRCPTRMVAGMACMLACCVLVHAVPTKKWLGSPACVPCPLMLPPRDGGEDSHENGGRGVNEATTVVLLEPMARPGWRVE